MILLDFKYLISVLFFGVEMLTTMGVHFIIKLLMINCNYLIQNQLTPNFFQCEKYNMPSIELMSN